MAVGTGPRKVHIAVLECLRLGKAISDSRGQFGDVFRAWLLTCATHYNATRSPADQLEVIVSSWDVEHGQYPPTLEGIDAVIVTGSTASAYDSDEWIAQLSNYLRG
jgi:GMP synthase-like glutamine amidotransferase